MQTDLNITADMQLLDSSWVHNGQHKRLCLAAIVAYRYTQALVKSKYFFETFSRCALKSLDAKTMQAWMEVLMSGFGISRR